MPAAFLPQADAVDKCQDDEDHHRQQHETGQHARPLAVATGSLGLCFARMDGVQVGHKERGADTREQQEHEEQCKKVLGSAGALPVLPSHVCRC